MVIADGWENVYRFILIVLLKDEFKDSWVALLLIADITADEACWWMAKLLAWALLFLLEYA